MRFLTHKSAMNLYFCMQSAGRPLNPILIKQLITYLFLLMSLVAGAQVRHLPETRSKSSLQQGNDSIVPSVPDSLKMKDFRVLRGDTMLRLMPQDSRSPDSLSMVRDSARKDSVRPPVLDAPIIYSAKDSMVISLDGKKVYLYKNADVKYQDIELKADYVELNLNTKEVYASGLPDSVNVMQGTPVFTQGSDKFESETLRYNFKSQKGIIQNLHTDQGEGHVTSERAKKVGKDIFLLKDGKYTTCDAAHPHFYLHMSRAKAISNKKIITGPAYMVLEDFPIYFPLIPFGFFPNSPSYSSGIVLPSYGEESNRGFFLKQGGYYWAASPYYDLKILGDIYSEGSWGLHIGSNYKKRYKYSGKVQFDYNVNQYGEKDLPDYYSTKGFNFQWTHSQDSKANPYQTFSASVNISTSSYDKENTTEDYNTYLSTTKSSSISYSKKWQNSPFSMSANLTHSQNSTDSTMSLSLPVLTFNMTKIYPFRQKNKSGKLNWLDKIGLTYSANIKNTISAREDSILHESLLKDWKNGWKHNLSLSLPSFTLLKYLNVSPSVSYAERWYTHNLKKRYYFNPVNQQEEVKTDTIYGFKRNYNYSFSMSSSTTIYGMYTFNNPRSRIVAIRHKMTPSVSFNYTPDFGAKKYGFWDSYANRDGNQIFYNRYADGVYGSAGRGKSESMSFSLTNTLEAKVRNKVTQQTSTDDVQDTAKQEKFKKVKILDNLGFSGSYNFVADSMNLSTIALRARTTIRGVSFSFNGTLDPYMADKNGSRYNQFAWNTSNGIHKLGRLTNLSSSFGMSFSSSKNKKKKNGQEQQNTQNRLPGQQQMNTEENQPTPILTTNELTYYDFSMPWNLSFNYSMSYSHTNPYKSPTISQSLNLQGRLSVTKKWNMNFTTNFDIDAWKISYTQINITRDLHCFNMSFNVVPFGTTKSYTFTIAASSSMLKDLKIDKRKSRYDY